MKSYCWVDSPVGRLFVAGDRCGLNAVCFSTGQGSFQPQPGWRETQSPFQEVMDQLGLYFAGRIKTFSLRLAPAGTAFQQKVWRVLKQIPYGTTVSYGQVAERIGRPGAARAVGAACGRNPISIVVPCHRVVGANGQLTGFGGGVATKEALLNLETRSSTP